ncbi:ABC transporter permease [Prescottella agglutinans]|uniref:ABC transporter permease n=2 Tax=Prescottella agglutinans TaxID=1644129 RepID=A0A3S3BG27_9NOCA|nr:ABC transporter permease [Prescottella agglutinans]
MRMPNTTDQRQQEWTQAIEADTEAVAPALHLDHGPAPQPAGPGRPPWRMIVESMVFPLFFAVMFALCYVSAFHNPAPRGVEVVLVGPESAATTLVERLAPTVGDKFDLSTATDAAGALDRLQNREIAGVIELGSTMNVHIASAEGTMRVQAVEGLAGPLAAAQGVEMNTVDHAPLAADDPTGTGLFYLVMVSTIVGYLTITVLSQVAPRLKLRQQVGVLGVMSVIGVVAAYLVSAIFVGFYGASFATSLALLAVVIAYTIVVGLVSILVNRVFGKAAIMVVMILMIFVNFPSAGGAFPADFLPGFWSGLSHFWIGAGAVDATRSIVYFGGTGVGHGLLVIAGWLVVTAALLGLTQLRKPSAAEAPKHLAG